MTTFDEAARKAADEMGYLYELSSEEEVARIITKHYADLEATFGLLCELARLSEQVCDDNMQMAEMLYGRDEEGGVPVPQHVSRIYAILNDPRIAALLKKDAFDKGAENG